MPQQRRIYQIAEKIRAGIALKLARIADPRLELVTITSVVVSPDLRQAKVYWMASGDKQRLEDIGTAFKGASGMFRRAIAGDLGLRSVPELKFFYDDTLDTCEEVERLMSKIGDGVK